MVQTLYEQAINNAADLVECEINYVFKDHTVRNETNIKKELTNIKASEYFLDRTIDIKSAVWNKIYKSELVKNVQFPLGRLHEDMYFTYLILYNCKKYYRIELCKYNYRQERDGSIMTESLKSKIFQIKLMGMSFETISMNLMGSMCFLKNLEQVIFRALLHFICRIHFSLKDNQEIRKFVIKKLDTNKELISSNKYLHKAKLAYLLYRIHPNLLFLTFKLKYGKGKILRKKVRMLNA
jgi:hypothetical protein